VSWDIIAFDVPQTIESVGEIPRDFKPKSLGTRSSLILKIKEIFPTADFSDPSWGFIDGADWSIEVSLGKDQDCDSLALHVRGSDAAVPAVARILNGLKIRGMDCQTTEFFDAGPNALESFQQWRAFRDHAVSMTHEADPRRPSIAGFSRLVDTFRKIVRVFRLTGR